MGSIRRYGPSMVAPQVMPRPQLGKGAQATFQVFENTFNKVNEFIRPAVVQHQTAKGEAEALAAVEQNGPQFELQQTRGPGNVAVDVQNGQQTAFGQHGSGDDLILSTIRGHEGFRKKPYWDVNHFRVGYGSDTITLPDGTVQKVTKGMVVTQEDAERDLRRRAKTEFIPKAEKAAGERWNEMSEGQRSALVSLAYNYGSVPQRVASVIKRGGSDKEIAQAISDLGSDNNGINKQRRESEAEMFLGGNPRITTGVPQTPEYELRQTNANTFEPRQPFTVRSQAFNAAADRVIQGRAMVAMEQGIAAAQQKANGDLKVLAEEMDKVRATVLGGLPDEMPGLKTTLEESFTRAKGVATRQAITLAERRVLAQQTEAMAASIGAISGEAERLALTGASGDELAAHLTRSQDALAQFGPREGFTLNGQEYPPDPSRAGTMTPAAIEQQLGAASNSARRVMIEAEFQRSAAPGQFVDEFRRQVMSGNSPLPAGESLDLLRKLESRARSTESTRRREAAAAKARLKEVTDTRINAFVEMTDAGVPVAIPAAERQQILSALSPYPELQREASEKFAVADAAVDTYNMSGPELISYVEAVRGDIAASVERGELDLEGVAVIQSLEDRVKKIQDAITAEMVGLPLVEQFIMDGAKAEQVDYDKLRVQAADNKDVIAKINEVEAFHRDIEAIRYMNADEREAALEVARQKLAELAAQGEFYGASALTTQKVVDSLEAWSDHRKDLASNDAVKFAEASGIDLPSFEGVQGLGEFGNVLAQRIAAVKPATTAEGVENPVPLTRAEVDGISEIYRNSPQGEKMGFLGAIASLGEDQANAIFAKVGASEPTLFAAGTIYAGGNQEAASVILRGSVDTKLKGGTKLDVAMARKSAIGDLFTSYVLKDESIAGLDAAALAYARGIAMNNGGRAITKDDIEEGFAIAVGGQQDGTGGLAKTEYGTTLAPPGWVGSHGLFGGNGRSIEAAIGSIDDEKLTQITKGLVLDQFKRPIDAAGLLRSIEGLRPSPNDPYILVPVDADGAVFLTDNGEDTGILQFDLREFEQ